MMISNIILFPEDDQSILIETSSGNQPVLFRTIYYSKENFYMVSPQTVFTYPLHHAKLQVLIIRSEVLSLK